MLQADQAVTNSNCQGPHCSQPIESLPRSRQRHYCSDRCRMAASRYRAEQAEQARLQAEQEARAESEKAELRKRYAELTEESICLLHRMKQQFGLHIVSMIGAALIREHDQALAQEIAKKQSRHQTEHQLRKIGRDLDYPAVEALGLESGEARWYVWCIDPAHDLGLLFAAIDRPSQAVGYSGKYTTI